VLEHLFGSYEEFFKNLPSLLLAIKKSNPRMVVD
jgi:hypothetical protein